MGLNKPPTIPSPVSTSAFILQAIPQPIIQQLIMEKVPLSKLGYCITGITFPLRTNADVQNPGIKQAMLSPSLFSHARKSVTR